MWFNVDDNEIAEQQVSNEKKTVFVCVWGKGFSRPSGRDIELFPLLSFYISKQHSFLSRQQEPRQETALNKSLKSF